MHCPNLGHFNSIWVRRGNTVIKKVPVFSSFGYLVIDSVVAPHHKIDVSRQLMKTLQFSLRCLWFSNQSTLCCNSFSLIFVTTGSLFNLILTYFCHNI